MDLETLAIRYETLGEAEVRGSLDRITDSTRQMTLTQMEALKMNDALAASHETAAVATGAHGFQVGRLRQDLGSLVGRLTGTSLAIDRVGGALGAMAIGNVAIIGVLAGIAAIAFAYDKLADSLKGVTSEQEKQAAEFEKNQRLKEAGGKIGQEASALQAEVSAAQTKLDDLNRRLAHAAANPTAGSSRLDEGQNDVAGLRTQVADQKALLKQKEADLKAANDESFKEKQRSAFAALQTETTQLAELIKSNIATKEQRAKALADEKEYYAQAKAAAQFGNVEVAAEYEKLSEILKGAFTKADKPAKPSTKKDLPGLADFLAEQKAEVAAMKETHDLQVKLEEDSADKTAEKYAKIEALDRAYLVQIGSVYGFESSEYDAMLKEMEAHRKAHTDAIIAEGKRQTDAENKQADQQSQEDEKELKKREQLANQYARSTADIIGSVFKASLAKGGNAGSALTAFGDGILKQLGGIFIKMGEKSVAASPALALIRAGLSNIFTAPEASLAGGLALIALGEALDAIGSGGGGGGSSGPVGTPSQLNFSSGGYTLPGTNAASGAGAIKPAGPAPNITVIGPNDPSAQRQITELIAKAAVR